MSLLKLFFLFRMLFSTSLSYYIWVTWTTKACLFCQVFHTFPFPILNESFALLRFHCPYFLCSHLRYCRLGSLGTYEFLMPLISEFLDVEVLISFIITYLGFSTLSWSYKYLLNNWRNVGWRQGKDRTKEAFPLYL